MPEGGGAILELVKTILGLKSNNAREKVKEKEKVREKIERERERDRSKKRETGYTFINTG